MAAGAIRPLYRRVASRAQQFLHTLHGRYQRRLIREVKTTTRGSYRPWAPEPRFLQTNVAQAHSYHPNLHTRMAAGARFPCRLMINLLTGEATICLGRGPSGSRSLQVHEGAGGRALGHFWTLWYQTDEFPIDLQVNCRL